MSKLKIKKYLRPNTIEEAYELLCENENSQIIGGGAWLKLLPKEIEVAIDLSNCKLDYITESKDEIEIGSYVTLRKLELAPSVATYFGGIIPTSIGEVMGIPFRNIATIGGTVVGKFGFSDILTALLVLDTELIFYDKGNVSLERYLEGKFPKPDILLGIRIIKDVVGKGYYYTMKKTANDFSIVNIAITKSNQRFKIAIGARPGAATIAYDGIEYLNSLKVITDEAIEEATEIILDEMTFGSNARGSKEYRKEVVKGLISRGIRPARNSQVI